jgi:hypothetical protein
VGLERLDDRLLLSGAPSLPVHLGASPVTQVGVETWFHATFNDYGPDRVVIDWGDGTNSAAMVSSAQLLPGATADNHGISGEHVYVGGGNYTITATILGSGGAIGQVTSTASRPYPYYLTPPPPTPATGPVLSLFQGGATFGSHNPDLATADATALYNTILGRAPDAGGLANVVAALNSGTPATVVADILLHSTEYETDLVASHYQNDLGRAGSPAEIAEWVSLMQGGMTAEQVSTDFLASAEFNALHPDDASFVLGLYEDALERPPSLDEIASWTTGLGAGMSRTSAVADFLGSPEAAARSVGNFYEVVLGHPADPAALQADVADLQAGTTQADIAATVLGSAEFMADGKGTVGS